MGLPRYSFFLSALTVAGSLAVGTWIISPAESNAAGVTGGNIQAAGPGAQSTQEPGHEAAAAPAPSLSPAPTPSPPQNSNQIEVGAVAKPTPTPTPTPSPTTPPPAAPAPPLASGDGKVLYLTFDDGPDPKWTPNVLDVLAANGAHATFFMIGQSAAQHPDLVSRVRAGGNAVGNHTWSHPTLTAMSADNARDQVTRTSATLGGTSCARPPYGTTNATVGGIYASLGQRQLLWDVDTRDWTRPGVQAIVDAVNKGAKNGTIVLMHDGGSDRTQTVEAVRQLVPALKAAGWRLEAIPGC